MTAADRPITALEDSHARLLDLVDRLGPNDVTARSYCTDWTVADVLSHLGSGAEIHRLNLEAAVTGGERPGQADMQAVWDRWNAKTPQEKAADAVVADARFVEAAVALDDGRKDSLRFSMGPMELDLAGFLGTRLAEHTLHSWDIAVVVDPAATLPEDATGLILPSLARIVGFVGRPVEPYGTVPVHTTAPDSDLRLDVAEGGVTLVPGSAGAAGGPGLTIPAEAFVRLVYGRLDPDHTPAGVEGPEIARLRQVFPGV
jgi:uncharacterized protein (TIGR03083 family)